MWVLIFLWALDLWMDAWLFFVFFEYVRLGVRVVSDIFHDCCRWWWFCRVVSDCCIRVVGIDIAIYITINITIPIPIYITTTIIVINSRIDPHSLTTDIMIMTKNSISVDACQYATCDIVRIGYCVLSGWNSVACFLVWVCRVCWDCGGWGCCIVVFCDRVAIRVRVIPWILDFIS